MLAMYQKCQKSPRYFGWLYDLVLCTAGNNESLMEGAFSSQLIGGLLSNVDMFSGWLYVTNIVLILTGCWQLIVGF